MADTLEHRLEPGETVVWRDRRTRTGLYVLLGVFALPVLAGIVALAVVGAGGDLFVVGSVMICLWLAMGLATAMLVVGDPTETLVTDRRVLLRRRSREDDGIDDIEFFLNQVMTLALRRVGIDLALQVTCHDGAAHRIGDLRDRGGFLAALCGTADLPQPPSIGRLERLNLCGAIFGYGLGVAFLYPFAVKHMDSDLLEKLQLNNTAIHLILFGLLAAAVLIFGFWLSRHLAALLIVLLMPRFATADEAQNWFDIGAEGRLAGWSVWKTPLYFKLASSRYGRTISLTGTDGNGHGV